MRNERRRRIVELINNFDIRTQREITEMLQKEGYKVTQATVSRDLKELRMGKNVAYAGRCLYSSHAALTEIDKNKLNTALFESVMSLKYAQNNVVIKTMPGLAAAVAANIDSLKNECILGSVAGDDTIIIVTTDEESAAFFSSQIRQFLRETGNMPKDGN